MKPRPGSFDPIVTRAAAEALADDLAGRAAYPHHRIVEALARAMDVDDEARLIESNLVADGWRADEPLRAVLAHASIARARAHRDAVERWVVKTGIRSAFALGDRVGGWSGKPSKFVSGTIVHINAKGARYTVKLANGRDALVDFEDTRPEPVERSPSP